MLFAFFFYKSVCFPSDIKSGSKISLSGPALSLSGTCIITSKDLHFHLRDLHHYFWTCIFHFWNLHYHFKDLHYCFRTCIILPYLSHPDNQNKRKEMNIMVTKVLGFLWSLTLVALHWLDLSLVGVGVWQLQTGWDKLSNFVGTELSSK